MMLLELFLVALALLVGATIALVYFRAQAKPSSVRVAGTSKWPTPPISWISSADFCLRDVSGSPIVEFKAASFQAQQLSDVPEALLHRLAPLQQALPEILRAGRLMDGKTVHISVEVSKLAKAANGELIGAVRDASGRWQTMPRLRPISMVGLIGPAAFQLLSIIVAQQHLAAIDAKLDEIKEGVQRIERFQRLEQLSKIRAGLAHIARQILPAALRGEWDQDMISRLGDFEADFASIGEQMVEELISERKKLADLAMKGSSAEKVFKDYNGCLARLNQSLECAILSVEARVLGATVLALKPNGTGIAATDRIAHINSDIEKLTAQIIGPAGLWTLARERVAKANASVLGHKLDSGKLQTQKALAFDQISASESGFSEAEWRIRTALTKAGEIPVGFGHPIELVAVQDADGHLDLKLLQK